MSDQSDDAAELERQLQRGSIYTHTLISQLADRANEIESFLYGLVDQLAVHGLVDPDRLAEAALKVRAEAAGRGEALVRGVARDAPGADVTAPRRRHDAADPRPRRRRSARRRRAVGARRRRHSLVDLSKEGRR